jgi:hypothetical protein
MRRLRLLLVLFVVVFLLPIGVSAGLYLRDGIGRDWWAADRSSAGLLPPAAETPGAVVRVFAAPTVRWRGIFAVHSWVVLTREGAAAYTRYDVTAWGEPLRVNGFVPDGRWFGRVPQVVFAADGPVAAALIPRMEAAIEAGATLPSTAIGRDFPHDGRWLRPAAGGAGLRLTLGGYAGITLGAVEGIEVNILGAVAGVDLLRPAVKLPGLGRIGVGAGEAWASRASR